MISFIIPAYNEERLLGATIGAVREAMEGRGQLYEIVVVDDDSSDLTADIAVSLGARVIHVIKRQIAATRNAGALAATGDDFIFVDADTRVTRAVIGAALDALCSGALGGGAAVELDGPVPAYANSLVKWGNWFMRSGQLAAGCFLFCNREAFFVAGGFDETFYCTEELVLSQALKRQGRFVILRESVVTSGRKLRAYSGWQLLRLTLGMLVRGQKSLKQRRGLEFWYDPRRQDSQTSNKCSA